MNYRKIIDTAIECEKLEARLSLLLNFYPLLRSEPELEHAKARDVMASIRIELQNNHDRLKQLVEETA
jgi:hypothetical protein